MTREEYLSQLKYLLGSLSEEERNEALQYYSDYFEEASDDAKVMAELGSPEELARSVNEKFANAVMRSDSEREENGGAKKDSSTDALCFNYNKDSVKSLEVKFGAAEVVFITGNSYGVETRGIDSQNFECSLGSDGVLFVRNTNKISFDFLTRDRRKHIVPRILVSIPRDAFLERFKMAVGAGRLRMKDVSFSCNSCEIEVGAGSAECGNIVSRKTGIKCGMGNVEYSGEVSGKTSIDCGMGAVKLKSSGVADSFSYDLKLGLGEFNFNGDKKAGVCQIQADEKKDNHFAVNCGMGNVSVYIG